MVFKNAAGDLNEDGEIKFVRYLYFFLLQKSKKSYKKISHNKSEAPPSKNLINLEFIF